MATPGAAPAAAPAPAPAPRASTPRQSGEAQTAAAAAEHGAGGGVGALVAGVLHQAAPFIGAAVLAGGVALLYMGSRKRAARAAAAPATEADAEEVDGDWEDEESGGGDVETGDGRRAPAASAAALRAKRRADADATLAAVAAKAGWGRPGIVRKADAFGDADLSQPEQQPGEQPASPIPVCPCCGKKAELRCGRCKSVSTARGSARRCTGRSTRRRAWHDGVVASLQWLR